MNWTCHSSKLGKKAIIHIQIKIGGNKDKIGDEKLGNIKRVELMNKSKSSFLEKTNKIKNHVIRIIFFPQSRKTKKIIFNKRGR